MEVLGLVAEVDGEPNQLRVALGAVRAARGDEEVGQLGRGTVAPVGGVDQHEAAGAEPGQRALGDERGQDSADRCIHGVSALSQRLRPGLRGDRVAGGHYSPCGATRPD